MFLASPIAPDVPLSVAENDCPQCQAEEKPVPARIVQLSCGIYYGNVTLK
jgi:hypothetical protein